jgi:hypothetical protein
LTESESLLYCELKLAAMTFNYFISELNYEASHKDGQVVDATYHPAGGYYCAQWYFAWSRYQVTQAKEISIADTCPSEQYLGEIYIGGAVANPELAIISVGSNNEYGHPSPEVMARLIEKVGSENIYRTDEHGTIEFITDGERLWVRTEQ